MKLKIIFLVLVVIVAFTGWFLSTASESVSTPSSSRSSSSSSDDAFKNF